MNILTPAQSWQNLADHLATLSKAICRDNGCTEEKHNCESYAYITEHGALIEVCASGFFQGWGADDIASHGNFAAVAMPWSGSGADLIKAVADDLPLG